MHADTVLVRPSSTKNHTRSTPVGLSSCARGVTLYPDSDPPSLASGETSPVLVPFVDLSLSCDAVPLCGARPGGVVSVAVTPKAVRNDERSKLWITGSTHHGLAAVRILQCHVLIFTLIRHINDIVT